MKHIVGHLERIGQGRALVCDAEQVLVRDDDQRIDIFLQFLDPGVGDAHPLHALEMKRLGHHANRQDPRFARDAGDDRRRAGAGAAAHAGGQEHHVGALHRFENVVDRLLGGGPADIRPGAGAEPAGDADTELDLARRGRQRQRLSVGVGGDELAPHHVRADHVVDGIPPGAADPDDGDAGLKLLLILRDAEINHRVGLHPCAAAEHVRPPVLPLEAGSPLVPIAADRSENGSVSFAVPW